LAPGSVSGTQHSKGPRVAQRTDYAPL